MTNEPYVSVIVPTYKDNERLGQCVSALLSQTYPKEKTEVIVVNNDPTEEIVALPRSNVLRVITEPKPGSYAARNRGVIEANGTIIAFTDSDCLPRPDWLSKAIPPFMSEHARVAGEIRLFSTSSRRLTTPELYEMLFAFNQRAMVNRGTAMTANLLVKRDIFDSVGLFNENLLSGGDSEWGLRASKKGYDIVHVAAAVVEHPARASLRELFRKARRVTGSIRIVNNYGGHHRWLLRGLHPPIKKMVVVMRSDSMTLRERLKVISLLYALKLFQTISRILIYTQISSPKRS